MIKNILKGIVIGVANIIPGVSGGTMAVSMGIYDKLIHALTHIKSEFKKSMSLIIPILIGAAIALVGLSFMISLMFEKYPIPTNLLFIGLIIGGLPAMAKKVKGNKVKISHMISALAFFAMVVVMAMLGEGDGAAADLSFSAINVVKLFGVGVIASATMVIPGVSGSMMLMLLGYYYPIIDNIKAFIEALVHFDVDALIYGCGIFIPMGLGIVIGIVVIAKIIEWVFTKYSMIAYWAIIGLIIASPIAIILLSNFTYSNLWLTIAASVVAFGAGFFVSTKLGEE